MTTNVEMTVALARFAAELVAQRHRREHPEATEEEVRQVVLAWYASRPHAPDGDAVGTPRSWPRR